MHITLSLSHLTSADGLPLVEEVEHVSRSLVVDLEDRPERLRLPLALVGLRLGLAHLGLQLLQGGLDQLPTLRGPLGPGGGRGGVAEDADLGHREEWDEQGEEGEDGLGDDVVFGKDAEEFVFVGRRLFVFEVS